MVKFESQPSERIGVLERGGLTPEHWSYILSTLDIVLDDKLKKYGDAVVSGDKEDIGFAHRDYLGHRHWDMIEFHLRRLDQSKQSAESAVVHQEVLAYASLESLAYYSLSDYYFQWYDRDFIAGKLRYYEGRPTPQANYQFRELVWKSQKEEWKNSLTRLMVLKPGETTSVVSNITGLFSKRATVSTLLGEWLLTSQEVPNPLKTSPEGLFSIVRNIDEGELMKRLRSHLAQGSSKQMPTNIGGWEKEI